MRGGDGRSGELFSYVDLERRMPAGHPLGAVREMVNAALVGIGPDLEAVYSRVGRPSIAPEKLPPALLLQLFHGIRSERCRGPHGIICRFKSGTAGSGRALTGGACYKIGLCCRA